MVRTVEPDVAHEIADSLLARYGSLTGVLSASSEELDDATGNPVLAAILSETRGLVVESLLDDIARAPFSSSNQSVLRYLTVTMNGLAHEEAHIFFLDRHGRFLRHEVFNYGSEFQSYFPMHIVFRRAVQVAATQIVLIHNHPSGCPKPTSNDLETTQQIVAAGSAIGLKVYDHLIVAGSKVFSFRSADLL